MNSTNAYTIYPIILSLLKKLYYIIIKYLQNYMWHLEQYPKSFFSTIYSSEPLFCIDILLLTALEVYLLLLPGLVTGPAFPKFLNSFGITNFGTVFINGFYSSLINNSDAYIKNNLSIQSILKYKVILLTFFLSPIFETFLIWSAIKLQVFKMSLAKVGLLIES